MCGFFKHANGILRLPLPPQEENFSYYDVEKFAGYYAETTEKMQTMTQQGEVEVNYLKKSFGKWVVNENDSRQIQDLVHVTAEADGRSKYTINERYYKV